MKKFLPIMIIVCIGLSGCRDKRYQKSNTTELSGGLGSPRPSGKITWPLNSEFSDLEVFISASIIDYDSPQKPVLLYGEELRKLLRYFGEGEEDDGRLGLAKYGVTLTTRKGGKQLYLVCGDCWDSEGKLGRLHTGGDDFIQTFFKD